MPLMLDLRSCDWVYNLHQTFTNCFMEMNVWYSSRSSMTFFPSWPKFFNMAWFIVRMETTTIGTYYDHDALTQAPWITVSQNQCDLVYSYNENK